jgi:hypothetical protein
MGRIIAFVVSQIIVSVGSIGVYHACMKAAKDPRVKTRADWVEGKIKEEFEK